MGCRGRAL